MDIKILTICGSLQKRSANRALLDVAVKQYGESDVEVVKWEGIASIPALNPETAEPAPQSVKEFRQHLDEVDGVLIAAPEYAAGMPGALKNALDWIVGSAELYQKPVAVCSAGTSGGHYVREQLVRSLTWQGAHVVANYGLPQPKTLSDDDGNLTDLTVMEEIKQVAKLLAEVPAMSADDRLKRIVAVTEEAGVEPGHISPVFAE